MGVAPLAKAWWAHQFEIENPFFPSFFLFSGFVYFVFWNEISYQAIPYVSMTWTYMFTLLELSFNAKIFSWNPWLLLVSLYVLIRGMVFETKNFSIVFRHGSVILASLGPMPKRKEMNQCRKMWILAEISNFLFSRLLKMKAKFPSISLMIPVTHNDDDDKDKSLFKGCLEYFRHLFFFCFFFWFALLSIHPILMHFMMIMVDRRKEFRTLNHTYPLLRHLFRAMCRY